MSWLSLTGTSVGVLEIPAQGSPALIEQAALLVVCAVGGCRVIPQGRCIVGETVWMVVVRSKALWAS